MSAATGRTGAGQAARGIPQGIECFLATGFEIMISRRQQKRSC